MSLLKRIRNGPNIVKDQGFAWVVLLMSFLSHILNLGFGFGVVGTLTITHIELLGISLQSSSLIGSIHVAVLFMFAPVASVIVKLIGCQRSQIFGGFCIIMGLGLSTLTTQYWHAMILFGILTGVGQCITYTASTLILPVYFERRRNLAFSIAATGLYIGVGFWPIASYKLLDTFGYSTAMGIMAVPHVIHILAGFFYYQPINSSHKQTIEVESTPQDLQEVEQSCEEKKNKGCDNLALDCSQEDISVDREVEISDTTQYKNKELDTTEEKSKLMKTLREYISFVKSWKIWLLLVHNFLWGGNTGSFYILINNYIVQKTELTEDEVALGFTILGTANIVGCLAVSASSIKKYNRLLAQACYIMLYGVFTILIAFSTNKITFYILCACWGIVNGSTVANMVAMVNTFCAVDKLAALLGLALLFEGTGSLALTPLCSYIAEQISQLVAIILCGSFGVAAACCFIPIIVQRLKERRQTETADNGDNSLNNQDNV